MKHKLTRRGFSQLALSSVAAVTTTTVFGSFANKTFAKNSQSKDQLGQDVIYGLRAGAIAGGVQMQSLDLRTGEVKNLSALARTITVETGMQLTSFVALPDGHFLVAGNPSKNSQEDNRSRLIVLGKFPLVASGLKKNSKVKSLPFVSDLTVSGLSKNSKVESLLVTQEGALIALVGQPKSQPPFTLVAIDRQTGQASVIADFLPKDKRFSTLAQASSGTIYASCVEQDTSDTSLVQLDLQQRQLNRLPQLHVGNILWQSGLRSLAFSPSGQLYALASHTHAPVNTLFAVDAGTGSMTALKDLAVNKITFALS